ncbi:MAG: BNR-4 repeat-containing protein [Bacteroidota bacterium]
MNELKLFFYAAFTIIFISHSQSHAQSKVGTLTNDGAWCWFSDPRAIYLDGQVITAWVKSEGTVEAARFGLSDQNVETDELYFRLERDDHNNPAFVATAAGKVLAMYTRHTRKDLFINILEDAKGVFNFTDVQFIHPFDGEQLKKFPQASITYANPYQLVEEDNRLYCFGRWTGFKPNLMWSDDGGENWTKSKVFITNYPFESNNRPYAKYYSDGKSKIHIVFTDGHPRIEPTNSVYYAYLEDGKFHRADGTIIVDMGHIPFEPKDASIIFRSNEKEGRAWIADMAQDEQGQPVILYTKSPKETDHRYWYARYINGEWVNYEICASGKWFPQTPQGQKEREPHYFGGMSLHPDNPNVVYLSRQVNGIFEIERWETKDDGQSWEREAITQDSEHDNVRPYVPRGLSKEDQEVVLWMENEFYIHYTNYQTKIRYWMR